MDSQLKELCLEVLNENIDSQKFTWLIIETGIKLESHEWTIANRLLEKGESLTMITKKFGDTVH